MIIWSGAFEHSPPTGTQVDIMEATLVGALMGVPHRQSDPVDLSACLTPRARLGHRPSIRQTEAPFLPGVGLPASAPPPGAFPLHTGVGAPGG